MNLIDWVNFRQIKSIRFELPNIFFEFVKKYLK
jgi:hypothetical protein